MLYKYFNNFFANFIYNAIYSFSLLQIKLNKMQKYFIKNEVKRHTYDLCVELYDNGNFIKRMDIIDYLKHWEKETDAFNYMIVVNDDGTKQKQKITNKKCLCLCDKSNQCGYKFELSWKKSTVKFMSIVLIFSNGTEYQINLLTKTENYYIVGNRIDREFIRYYLLKHYNLRISEFEEYTIQLFDHKAKCRQIKYPEGIEITETDYRIIQ